MCAASVAELVRQTVRCVERILSCIEEEKDGTALPKRNGAVWS